MINQTKTMIVIRKNEYQVESGVQLTTAIAGLGLNPESYFALCNGEIIPLEAILQPGDTVKLFPVISGGCQASSR